MPMEALLQILQDSLEKKIDLLADIEEKSKEQEAIIKKENFTFFTKKYFHTLAFLFVWRYNLLNR